MNPDPVLGVCGEALVDLVPAGEDRYAAVAGGGPANTAVALARLGTPTAFVGRLGRDRLAALSRRRLTASGVDLRWCVAASEPAMVALADVDSAGQADYTFYLTGTADLGWQADELPDLPETVLAVHAGSLALLLPPGAPVVESWLRGQYEHHTVSVDPNVRPALAGGATYRAALARWSSYADVVKLSVDDLAHTHPGEDPARVAVGLCDQGPALVVVTLGAAGALAVGAAAGVVHRPGRTVEVVDTVGAGDAFAAGLLDALYRRGRLGRQALAGLPAEDLAAALDAATAVAAATCARPGADPPTRAELDRLST